MSYTIERVRDWDFDVDKEMVAFIREVGDFLSTAYGNKFSWRNFDILKYAEEDRITLCRKNGRPVGLMLARLATSIFDPSTKLFIQDVLYAKPRTKAAKLLMDDFIDFGKSNANHIITMIAERTNIKERSLERLGFKRLETYYRIEV